MPKNTTQFVCAECGYVSAKWLGRCPECGKYNTLAEEPVAPAVSAKKPSAPVSYTHLTLPTILRV